MAGEKTDIYKWKGDRARFMERSFRPLGHQVTFREGTLGVLRKVEKI